jgi:transposase
MTPATSAATIAELLAANEKLVARNQQLEAQNDWLRGHLQLAQHQQFGASSESTASAAVPGETVTAQGELVFNEAEAQAAPAAAEPTVETITYRRRKPRGKRTLQVAALPIEEVRYELPVSEQVCPQCANALHEMGHDVREEVKVIPAQGILVRHMQTKYACRHCALHGTGSPVVAAPMPAPAFPGSLASASAVAYVMNQKFELGLPLYRQEQHFQDLGLNLSRQTLANWMIKGAAHLTPLYDRLHEILRSRDILHADETPLQVLHEPGRAASTESRMWVYCSGRETPPLILYDYQMTRAGEHPRRFLKGFGGFLQVDGYVGYEGMENTTLVGCWAHVRRKFHDALKVLPAKSRATVTCPSRDGFNFCNQLFKVDSELREATPADRHAARQVQSAPILHKFRLWLDQQALTTAPQSQLGKAITYTRNQWPKLNTFMQDGRLELDNNRCERAVKPFVIGRKNWLFANTPKGARASATIYSIVETARANGLRPFDYLTFLFERLPNLESSASLDSLLPWAAEAQNACGETESKAP